MNNEGRRDGELKDNRNNKGMEELKDNRNYMNNEGRRDGELKDKN